jgi:putative PIN family toxin of toxin-antitoxin system
VVLDTSVLVAALRSSTGASSLLVDSVLSGRLKPLVSVPLALEYEAVLTRPEHLRVSCFTESEAIKIVKAFCKMGEPVHLTHRLRPQLLDPNDEFILETAFHGKAQAIVTFNCKDFKIAALKFGIQTIFPKEAWEKVRIL